MNARPLDGGSPLVSSVFCSDRFAIELPLLFIGDLGWK
jgi:hypothetical protein